MTPYHMRRGSTPFHKRPPSPPPASRQWRWDQLDKVLTLSGDLVPTDWNEELFWADCELAALIAEDEETRARDG